MKLIRRAGNTSNIFQIWIQDSSSTTGAGLSGLAYNSSGLAAYYHRDTDTTATAISLVTMTVGTFTSSGFAEIDATNMKGAYQFCPPDAALASGAKSVLFHIHGATNQATLVLEIELVAVDLQDGVHFGLTSLPNTAVTTNGSLITSGTGTAQLSVSSGLVNVGSINSVATSSVTTVNANIGTTQAITFDANNYPKVDLVDIAGTAVSTSSAQLGVNVVNAGATAWGSGAITAGSIASAALNGKGDWPVGKTGYSITGTITTLDALATHGDSAWATATGFATPTNITAGTITTVTNLTNAPTAGDLTATMKASVTTAATAATPTAAAVTGNVGGNVTGTIGGLASAAKTDVEDATWDATLSSHLGAGSTGAALNAAGAAGDPWSTSIPGAYGAGTAGYIVGTNVNATVSSRLASASISLSGGAVTVGTNNDKTGYSITSNIKENTGSQNLTFTMTDSTNHNPDPGLTVNSSVSIDGAGFVATANSVTEIADGDYNLVLNAADVNGKTCMFRFTATGADDLNLLVITQP